MKTLTYIWHDCFVYDDPRLTIIFDYWKDPTCLPGQLPAFIQQADKSKPIYIVVSHHHKDHYTKQIFEWSTLFDNIKYILSKDVAKYARHILHPDSIYKGIKPAPESVVVLTTGQTYSDNNIYVKAYGSTDIGNSYCISVAGKSIFHAGDLNAWIWKDESTEEEVDKAISDFDDILETIATDHKVIDFAMFPVDSRIGREYFTGAKIFVRKFDVKKFFPMHFGLGDTPEEQKKYQIDATRIDLYANPERGEYVCLQSPYAAFATP